MGITERKEREKLKRRNAIISAAEKIFFPKKGSAGTMDDVAEKVELSKGTLYLYFKNKEDLLLGIAEKGVNTLVKYLDPAKKTGLTGKEQLSNLGDEFTRFVEDFPNHFGLILKFESSQDKTHTRLMEPALVILNDIIKNGQNDCSIRDDINADELVVILWSQMQGVLQKLLHNVRFADSNKEEYYRIIKGHYRIIMKGISPSRDDS
jgi:TetR/AcrR family transcriptional regulator